ncbi:RNA polymerase sigma factor [Numidum massiliense]|uniref:RNA polymerase sigma factor n=1 Tax=Numidum massiliense TaxID=1522315 RepID=UPI000A3EB4E9|nr:RNA polymerase sigma factor [Numidum massiliense]
MQRILFEMFYQRVYKTAYYIVKDEHLAQDVLQDTFIKAFRHIEQCPDGERAGAWLATIASRTAIDYIRKQKRRNALPFDNVLIENNAFQREVASSVEQTVEDAFAIEEILREIDSLDADSRVVLILKYLHELKDQEIAEALDVKLGTVKSRIFRAKQKLSAILQKNRLMDGESL